MISGTKNEEKYLKWNHFYQPREVPIFKGRKQKLMVELLASLGLRGPSTSSELAKFVLSYGVSDGQESEITYKEIEELRNDYKRLLTGRLRYKHSKKKSQEKRYPGIVLNGYAKKVDKIINTKKKDVEVFFLTPKSSYLLMRYDFSNSELKLVIQNCSKNNMFFAYVNSILNKTNIKFVTEIFVKPIIDVIRKTQFFKDEDIRFYFTNIAESIGHALKLKLDEIEKEWFTTDNSKPLKEYLDEIKYEDLRKYPSKSLLDHIKEKVLEDELSDPKPLKQYRLESGIEDLINNTFYFEKRDNLFDSLVEHYYHNEESEEFYRTNSDNFYPDFDLLFKVMREIHYTYNLQVNGFVPKKPKQKLKPSIQVKKYRAYKRKLISSNLLE